MGTTGHFLFEEEVGGELALFDFDALGGGFGLAEAVAVVDLAQVGVGGRMEWHPSQMPVLPQQDLVVVHD